MQAHAVAQGAAGSVVCYQVERVLVEAGIHDGQNMLVLQLFENLNFLKELLASLLRKTHSM